MSALLTLDEIARLIEDRRTNARSLGFSQEEVDRLFATARAYWMKYMECERMGTELVEVEAENARLRAALDLLIRDCRFVAPDEPPERMIPTQHRVSDIRQARTALRATETKALA